MKFSAVVPICNDAELARELCKKFSLCFGFCHRIYALNIISC